MKCTLVFPGPSDYSELKKRPPLIHYGLCILAEELLQKGIEVEYIDCIAQRVDLEEFKKRIKLNKPFIVGFTATTSQVLDAQILARAIKEIDPGIYTVLGGVHASALPEEVLREFPEIDFVVRGEGIVTLPELIKSLSDNRPLAEVRGIAFRENGNIKVNEPREFVKNLDELPLPAYHLLDLKRYSTYSFFLTKVLELPVYLSIGCPYPCRYCFRLSGNDVRYRSAERTLEEIAIGIKRYGCRNFAFFDDTFGIHKERYIELLELLIKKGLHKKIS